MKYFLIVLIILTCCGCGKQTVVLLPDLDGNVGKVVVTPHEGDAVVLDKPLQTLKGTSSLSLMSEEDVEKNFKSALAAQPEPTAKFLLYFYHDSSKLKKSSRKLLSEIIKVYHDRSSTDISVIGHTDAVGDKKYNYNLSLRRAQKIGSYLMKKGIPADQIQIVSHGEENPLVKTRDGKSEPKNRRVEVLVR